ncbi:MAG: hypothetical protein B7X31_06745 [Thiomonas sp. 13-66-29]|nr:MAG: hypothetical protein B7X31_06745 [Thiomonas sp. 13-66-29]
MNIRRHHSEDTPMNATGSAAATLSAVDYDPFADTALSRVVPSTEAQREIWLACQLGTEASLAYNESISLRLRGPLDQTALRSALQALVDRHDALRATLGAEGQDLYIAEALELHVPVHDLTALNPEQREASLRQHIRAEVDTPFDLLRGPLLRAQIALLAEDDAVLMITAHHIVCDGWSFGVLVGELPALLVAAQAPGANPCAVASTLPATATYADYALAQFDETHLRRAEADTRYWVSLYDRSAPVLDLPTDRPRQPRRSFASAREDLRIDAALLDAARKLGARHGASLFATLFALFAGLVSRISGQEEVVIGVSTAGQAAEGQQGLVGHCVNLLPIRIATDPEHDAASLILQARTAVLDAYDHQGVSFGSLLKHLQLPRDPGRLPLVSALFNLDARIEPSAFAPTGLKAEIFSNPRSAENFEVYLNVTQDAEGLLLECQYKTALFDQATVRRWLELYRAALQRCSTDASQPLAAVLAPTVAEQAQLAAWNATSRPYPRDLRLSDLLLRGMRQNADATALVFEGQVVSYRELQSRAWQLAMALRAQGAGPGVLVGVCLERGIDLVVALVGVVLSGAAYVPLDPGLPTERLAGMAEDARLALLVTRRAEHAALGAACGPACHVLLLDAPFGEPATVDEPSLLGSATDPAYVIFTSGSTGRPKGAMNAHRGIVNRLLWMQDAYALRADERVLQKTPFSFDVSVWEFFWPLSVGAALVIAKPDGHRDSAYLAELVQRERIDVMHFVPSMLRFFLDEPAAAGCTTLRQVVCSGEALPIDLVERFFRLLPQARLDDLYGPTEAAVDVSAWSCRPGEPSGGVPIGAPIANTQLHVLDAHMRQLPIGVAGDLYIGGVQVGLGYVARPDLTAERFIGDPFNPSGRLYKTGDLARWRADGALDYLGRSDHQVKLRGYRIELGEIENHLLGLHGISQAVAIVREDTPGDPRVAAYVVSQAGNLDTELLRDRLRQVLPDYMVPQNILRLGEIPLLSSGKVDRRALPAPAMPQTASARGRIAPRSALERVVLEAMEQVLKLPAMSVTDDFFALGGHSLLAARLVTALNRELDLNLPLRVLFESPTAERMAQAVERARQDGGVKRAAIRHDPARTSAPLTAQQERIAFMEELHPGRVIYNSPSAHRLRGPLDLSAFEAALREMVRRQPVLRTAIHTVEGGHKQVVLDAVPFNLPIEDLSALPEAAREAELMRRMQALVDQPIDIHQAPLFRIAMYRLAPHEHAFLFMPHHIIWDGWSFDLFYTEMAACYGALVRGVPAPLPALPVTYADYAHWQADWMQSEDFDRQLRDWNARMTQAPAPRAPRTDKPRSAGMSGEGATEWVRIDAPSAERLRGIARQADVTLNMLTLAVYGAMMASVAASPTIVVGVPVRGRMMAEVEPVMGFFNNLLPLQLHIDPTQPATAFLRDVKRELLDVMNFQDIPFERLAMEPDMMARSQHAGIYQALFSFQDARERERQWGGLAQSSILIFQKGATEDLGLWLMEVPHGLEGGITYNADIYTARTAEALRARYLELLERLAAEPQQTLAALLDDSASAPAASLRHLAAAPDDAPVLAGAASPVRQPKAPGRALTPTEQSLTEVWASLLGLQAAQIEPRDNYFDLGGDSLTAMQAVIRMYERTGKRANARLLIFESLEQIASSYDAMPSETAHKPGLVRRLFGGLHRGKKDRVEL